MVNAEAGNMIIYKCVAGVIYKCGNVRKERSTIHTIHGF